MEFCIYEFIYDIDSQTSLYQCINCGKYQKAHDDPATTECQKQKPKSSTEKP